METLGRFGLDPILLAAQVVNFLIIAFVLYRFLLRPLLATMKARREKIAQGLEDAEKARGALAEAAKEREKIIQEASAQAFRMLEGARGEAERLRAAALDKAGKDAERLIEESRDRIALERQEMEKAVQGLSLELSGKILETVVGELFSEEEKARILARGIERIRRSGAA
jgi:F-type H+-transporting ATPase subunit b